MKCKIHNNEASGICPSCGRALCPDCDTAAGVSRVACSTECLANLEILDEAAILTVTNAKKTMVANVWFCRLLGGVFITVGFVAALWDVGLAAFLVVMGSAVILGGQIYARALRTPDDSNRVTGSD